MAKAHHREDVVERLEHQLDQVQRDHASLVALLAVIHQRYAPSWRSIASTFATSWFVAPGR